MKKKSTGRGRGKPTEAEPNPAAASPQPKAAATDTIDPSSDLEAVVVTYPDTPPHVPVDVPELGGRHLLGRLEPEVVYVNRVRLLKLGVDSPRVTVNDENSLALRRLLQYSLRHAKGQPFLAYPGVKGLDMLKLLPTERVADLASRSIVHSGIFQAKPSGEVKK